MHLFLLVLSLVLLLLAASNVSSRVNLLALGLAFWMLDLVIRSGAVG